MEKKKESPLPMLVLLTTIGIGMIMVAWFVFLAE
jgi:multisubunit Na+/H+ antiporter MnhC subunit